MKEIPITFRATFAPKVKHFKVELIIPEKGRWVELMTISKFLRWTKEIDDSELSIGGMKVKLDGDESGETRKVINNYFKKVAESYKIHKGYYPDLNN